MKIIDERETRKKNKDRKEKGGCFPFKLGFLQLTCKTSLIFMLNLELALSVILK